MNYPVKIKQSFIYGQNLEGWTLLKDEGDLRVWYLLDEKEHLHVTDGDQVWELAGRDCSCKDCGELMRGDKK